MFSVHHGFVSIYTQYIYMCIYLASIIIYAVYHYTHYYVINHYKILIGYSCQCQLSLTRIDRYLYTIILFIFVFFLHICKKNIINFPIGKLEENKICALMRIFNNVYRPIIASFRVQIYYRYMSILKYRYKCR